MAVTCLTGIPRSGKTYYAMFLLYMQFIFKSSNTFFSKFKDKYFPKHHKQYDVAYTNINQFDYTKSDKIKPYNFNVVQSHLAIMHAMKMQEKPDSELIAYAKLNGLYNCLFVIDEAQNFFDKENVVSVWWFTYHGHLHQDIILITQNLNLIFSKYTNNSEFFYKAVPPSSRFFSNKFRYIQFNSAKLLKSDKIGDFHVPMIPKIFDMYVSGAENNAPSHVKKYLKYFIVLFIVLVIAFKMFVSSFETQSKNDMPKDKNETSPVTVENDKPKPLNKKVLKEDDNKSMLFDIRCVDMLCTYQNVDFPKPLLNKIIKKTPPEFIWFYNNSTYIQYFVMLPKDTFDFLKIGENYNEKSTKSNDFNAHNTIPKLVSK